MPRKGNRKFIRIANARERARANVAGGRRGESNGTDKNPDHAAGTEIEMHEQNFCIPLAKPLKMMKSSEK